jgi:hypothetical protein
MSRPLLGSSSADVLEWGTALADPYRRAELIAQQLEQTRVVNAATLHLLRCGTSRNTVGDKKEKKKKGSKSA